MHSQPKIRNPRGKHDKNIATVACFGGKYSLKSLRESHKPFSSKLQVSWKPFRTLNAYNWNDTALEHPSSKLCLQCFYSILRPFNRSGTLPVKTVVCLLWLWRKLLQFEKITSWSLLSCFMGSVASNVASILGTKSQDIMPTATLTTLPSVSPKLSNLWQA